MGIIRNLLTDPGMAAVTDPHSQMAQHSYSGMPSGQAPFPRQMSRREFGRFQEFTSAQREHDLNKFKMQNDAIRSNAELAHSHNMALVQAQGEQQRLTDAANNASNRLSQESAQTHALNLQDSQQTHARGMQADAHEQGLVANSMAHQNRMEMVNTLGQQTSPVHASWGADGSATFHNSAMSSSPQQSQPGGSQAKPGATKSSPRSTKRVDAGGLD